jgi:hypothetical protein
MAALAVAEFPLAPIVNDAPWALDLNFFIDWAASVADDFTATPNADLWCVRIGAPPAFSFKLTTLGEAPGLVFAGPATFSVAASLAQMAAVTPGLYACELRQVDGEGNPVQSLLMFRQPVYGGLSAGALNANDPAQWPGNNQGRLDVAVRAPGAWSVIRPASD